MSRKLLAILLAELKTVRLICPRDACGAVTEVSLQRMDTVGSNGSCPVCNHDLYPGGGFSTSPLSKLSAAIQAVQIAQQKPDAVQVEFILPDVVDEK